MVGSFHSEHCPSGLSRFQSHLLMISRLARAPEQKRRGVPCCQLGWTEQIFRRAQQISFAIVRSCPHTPRCDSTHASTGTATGLILHSERRSTRSSHHAAVWGGERERGRASPPPRHRPPAGLQIGQFKPGAVSAGPPGNRGTAILSHSPCLSLSSCTSGRLLCVLVGT